MKLCFVDQLKNFERCHLNSKYNDTLIYYLTVKHAKKVIIITRTQENYYSVSTILDIALCRDDT